MVMRVGAARPSGLRYQVVTLSDWSGSTDADETSHHPQSTLIAIVDDDRWAREGMHSFVVSLGYRGAMFASAEEYLQSELKRFTKCLILDVHLPAMSGPDLQARLINDEYRTPVIFVTAQFEQHVRDRVIAAGAFAYLTKPCDESILIDCLANAVGKEWSETRS
jgi:FixJ family two-component response regulator